MLPGHDPEGIWQTLVNVIDNTAISVTPIEAAIASEPSPLTDELVFLDRLVRRLTSD